MASAYVNIRFNLIVIELPLCTYDHKNKCKCQLQPRSWLGCQSVLSNPAHSVLNLMRAAFSHFKASWVPLTVNLQPCLVATGVSPRNPPVADALLIRPSRWDRRAPWEARTTVPFMARTLSSLGARLVTHQHPLNPDGWHPSCPPAPPPPPSRCAPLLPYSSSSTGWRPNMAEGRDGVQCWGLWMVDVGYKRWTGTAENRSWFSSSTGWVFLSEPQKHS